MMPQQQEQQAQTDQTLLVIHGFAEPSIFAHQQDFPLLDTPYSDLQAEVHRVEEGEDSPEAEAAFQGEEEVDSQAEEVPEDNSLNQETHMQETD